MSKTGGRSCAGSGKWESKEFRSSEGRKNHSAASPALEKSMEKTDQASGRTPKLFGRAVGVRAVQNGGQRNG